MGERLAGSTVTGSTTGASEKRSKLEGQGDGLLPGIPNKITLDHICTKLPWEAFHALSTVSPTWREVLQSRRVYNARVSARSTNTLLVHSHPFEIDFSCEQLHLFSPREKRCYELPQIPGCLRGLPWECQCISLEGKIYVLGGGTGYCESCGNEDDDGYKEVYKEVYVLDLVDPGETLGRPTWRSEWKQCASMQEGRLKFGCGLMGGKIYVFGGASHYGPVHGSEVYDPVANTWSSTRPTKLLRFGHHVDTMGEVLLVYGGEVFDPDHNELHPFLNKYGRRIANTSVHDAMFLEAYHPAKDEWREVERFQTQDSEFVFVVEGKFHLITQLGIYVQDVDGKTWKELHSNSFPFLRHYQNIEFKPHAPVIGGDAVYLGVDWSNKHWSCGSCLLEGKGFGSKKLEIVWDGPYCGEASQDFADLKCGIQL